MPHYIPHKYSLGLDIGTSSVGWAVIDIEKERIHDLGVRIFERPEDPQNGDSLAKPRRDARSARKRLKRRRQRLNNLKHFFVVNNILSKEQVEEVLRPSSAYNKLDVYELREKALGGELSPEELLKVFYQIAKRRGFKSNRKVEEESDKEGGRVTKSLSINQKFLADNDYKTVGSALAKDEKFASHKRNKRDDYSNSFARADFTHELEAIITMQQNYALKNISKQAISELVYGTYEGEVKNESAIMYQRPFMTPELIEKMVGECTFESGEKRAPRASHSFEIFRLASDLAHLVYLPVTGNKRQARRSGNRITLTPEQIKLVIDEAKKTRSLSYGRVRKLAGISEDFAPEYIRGKIKDDDPTGEKNKFGELSAYHDIKAAFKNLPQDWAKIDNEETLNDIAYILTTQRADDAIIKAANNLPIPEEGKRAILKIKPKQFKTFGHLSIKALQKITPFIIDGETYDKACEKAGYDFRKKAASLEQITNPVVRRAISQTNKVVRAIERKYGKPYFIKIETARDLAKNFKDRKAIENENKENQAKNQQIIDDLKENWGVLNPTGQQILKMKLRREQNGVCLYSGDAIDVETMLVDDNAYQIDHIVPFSRSNNDGLTNKVLVKTEENQKKANRTPFEYFGSDEARWTHFCKRVEATYQTRDVKTKDKKANVDNYKYNGYAMRKKQNLLIEEYKNDSWNVRALNDTRYITKFMMNYLRQTVDFADGEERQRVFAPNGTITAYLRKRWGLAKIREEDVLHHAADAAIVAAISPGVILRANLYAKKGEISNYLAAAKTIDEKTDKLTGEIADDEEFSAAQRRKGAHEVLSSDHFPEPWKDFRKEVRKRTVNTDPATLQNELRGLEKYEDDEFRLNIKPIFVSCMARRKTTGSAHEKTLYSPKAKNGNQRSKRVDIKSIRLCDLENTLLDKNDSLIQQINSIIKSSEKYKKEPSEKKKNNIKLGEVFSGDIYKANKKTDKNGNPISPVSSLRVYSTKTSGYLINNNKAYVENGDTICLNIYKHKFGYFAAPVYVHLKNEKYFPVKPIPKGKTKVEKEYWNGLRNDDGEVLSVPENGFEKVCSIFPNEYVKVVNKNGEIKEGYYVKFGIGNGNIVLVPHYVSGKDEKNHINVGVGTVDKLQKTKINVLGDNYRRL